MGTKNNWTLWSKGDIKQMRSMWKKKLSIKKIAKTVKRTETAVMKKATKLGLRKPKYLHASTYDKGFAGQDTKKTAEDIKKIISETDRTMVVPTTFQQPTGDEFPQSVDDDTLAGGTSEEDKAEEAGG